MRDNRTAKQILEDNAKLFAERDQILTELARNNPYRHPPNVRTWQDWTEIQRESAVDHPLTAEGSRKLHKALALAPTLEVFEALLEGETVPAERFDKERMKAYGLR